MTLVEELELVKTTKLKAAFFDIASMGVSMGLMDPYEWYVNSVRISYLMNPEKQQAIRDEAVTATAYFIRHTASAPEEDAFYKNVTDKELVLWLSLQHKKRRLKHEACCSRK